MYPARGNGDHAVPLRGEGLRGRRVDQGGLQRQRRRRRGLGPLRAVQPRLGGVGEKVRREAERISRQGLCVSKYLFWFV